MQTLKLSLTRYIYSQTYIKRSPTGNDGVGAKYKLTARYIGIGVIKIEEKRHFMP